MPFRPFNEHEPVRIYFTNLPHWRRDGCTYFVTYRLADSIPREVLERWERDRIEWLRQRGINVPDVSSWQETLPLLDDAARQEFLRHFDRLTDTFLDQGQGSCLLREARCAQLIEDSWGHFDGGHYRLGDLVDMPNHVHVMVEPRPGHELEAILQSRKRQSSATINLLLGRRGSLWQKHSYDHIVRNEPELANYRSYIADNPRKAGLRAGEYLLRVAEQP